MKRLTIIFFSILLLFIINNAYSATPGLVFYNSAVSGLKRSYIVTTNGNFSPIRFSNGTKYFANGNKANLGWITADATGYAQGIKIPIQSASSIGSSAANITEVAVGAVQTVTKADLAFAAAQMLTSNPYVKTALFATSVLYPLVMQSGLQSSNSGSEPQIVSTTPLPPRAKISGLEAQLQNGTWGGLDEAATSFAPWLGGSSYQYQGYVEPGQSYGIIVRIAPGGQTTSYEYMLVIRGDYNSATCPTGYDKISGQCIKQPNYNAPAQPATAQEINNKIAPLINNMADISGLLKELVDTAISANDPTIDAMLPSFSSTPNITLPFTTKSLGQSQESTPDGFTITSDKTLNIEKIGDNTFNAWETVVKTTKAPNGTITNTTTINNPATLPTNTPVIQSNPVNTTSGTVNPVGEFYTDCDKYPETLGCQKIAPLDPATITPTTILPSYNPQSWFGGSLTCPAPINITSKHIDFSYQKYCDNAIAIKPIIIASGLFIGAVILIGGIKT